jgi:AraC-like DNA-binding protein
VYTVPAALRPWISDVRVDAVEQSRILVHLPEPAVTLVWRGYGEVKVLGPRTQAAYFEGKDLPVCVRFRVRPGCARPVLGVDADLLSDRPVSLRELWGRSGGRLDAELADNDPAEVVQRLETALLQRLSAHQPRDTALTRHAVSGLAAGVGQPAERVRDVARRLGVSERHLRDVFTTSVGVSPKQFARITRVRTVLSGTGTLAQLAGDAGYYDQSHMTAEFRSMMHVTPGAYAAGRLPDAVAC